MRISTILGISVSLATGIVLGWNVTSNQTDPAHSDLRKKESFKSNITSYDGLNKNSIAYIPPSDPQDSNLPNPATNNPKDFAENTDNESAALLAAESLLLAENFDDYKAIRKAFEGKETQIADWIFLDAQEKIIEGKFKEAASLLQNLKFTGENEVNRLIKLAALNVTEEPKKAWTYLAEAVLISPDNPDVHLFRASLAESLGRNEIAASEYIAAMQTDPANPQYHEELADFYIRTKEYSKAIKILQALSQQSINSQNISQNLLVEGIWLKALFWTKTAMPLVKPLRYTSSTFKSNDLNDFISYLSALPEGIFWDQIAFNELPNADFFLNELQETYWLQLLADLKSGNESEALDRIRQNPFRESSWSPKLEKALLTTLNFRKAMESAPKNLSIYAAPSSIDNPQVFFDHLASLSDVQRNELPSKIPLDLHDYLLSEDAFVISFIAAKWTEAAIQLHSLKREDPASFPGWISAAFALALEHNRGPTKAIDFALAQKPSPALSLCLAQMALATDEKGIAFNALKKVYTSNSEEGQSAALLLGQFLMEQRNVKDAKRAIEAQPTLLNNPEAKGILARIAVEENDLDKASKLYADLEPHSSEAKSFLACRAFTEKNWKRAKQLTIALLAEYPDNQTLIDNLKKITAEETKAAKLKKITP